MPQPKDTASNRRQCSVCGKTFLAFPSDSKQTCSRECRKAIPWGNVKHGESGGRLHNIWCGMKSRCKGTCSASARHYYRDRGITVCSEWAESFAAFKEWALANGYDETLELDRIDNDGNYCPENCRWATRSQQMTNTRKRNDGSRSRFKGVSWHPGTQKWRAQIQRDRKYRHIGLYPTEEEAAVAYDDAAFKESNQFSVLNFPERYSQGGVSF